MTHSIKPARQRSRNSANAQRIGRPEKASPFASFCVMLALTMLCWAAVAGIGWAFKVAAVATLCVVASVAVVVGCIYLIVYGNHRARWLAAGVLANLAILVWWVAAG